MMQEDTSDMPISTTASRTDHGIIGLDEDDRPRRRVRHVGLRIGGLDGITFGVGLGVVGALHSEGPHHPAINRAVPAVVVGGAQKGLIDGSSDEIVDGRIIGEHVLQRIRLALDPEAVVARDVGGDAVGR